MASDTPSLTQADVVGFVDGSNPDLVEDYIRRMWAIRQPIPSDFIRVLPKAGLSLEYYPWPIIAEAMDAIFPGAWEVVVKDVTYVPIETVTIRSGSKTLYEILATVSVTVNGSRWGLPSITRENVGQHYNFERRGDGSIVPNDKGAETATHAGFRRACAMFGAGRYLYIRDEADRKKPFEMSVADLIAMRYPLISDAFELRTALLHAVREKKVDLEYVTGVFSGITMAMLNPEDLAKPGEDGITGARNKFASWFRRLKRLVQNAPEPTSEPTEEPTPSEESKT